MDEKEKMKRRYSEAFYRMLIDEEELESLKGVPDPVQGDSMAHQKEHSLKVEPSDEGYAE